MAQPVHVVPFPLPHLHRIRLQQLAPAPVVRVAGVRRHVHPLGLLVPAGGGLGLLGLFHKRLLLLGNLLSLLGEGGLSLGNLPLFVGLATAIFRQAPLLFGKFGCWSASR